MGIDRKAPGLGWLLAAARRRGRAARLRLAEARELFFRAFEQELDIVALGITELQEGAAAGVGRGVVALQEAESTAIAVLRKWTAKGMGVLPQRVALGFGAAARRVAGGSGVVGRWTAIGARAVARGAWVGVSAIGRRVSVGAGAIGRRMSVVGGATGRGAVDLLRVTSSRSITALAAARGRGSAALLRFAARARGRLTSAGRQVADGARGVRLVRPSAPQLVLVTVVLVAGSWVAFRSCGIGGCPDIGTLTVYQPNGAPVLLDRHGVRFADLAPFERFVVPLGDLPRHVPDAFIAVEDRRFYSHGGVDWPRVAGAALANVRARGIRQGSSTIPMQLARNIFPNRLPGSDRTFRRKLMETRVAQQIEDRYSKDEILELYLNHIYFGGGAWGIEAAARRYFATSASALTTEQAALLAALPRAPSHYDPRRNPERALQRRNLVLSLMERQGLIPTDEAERARASALRVPADPPRTDVPLGAYFADVVRDQVDAILAGAGYRSGLRIHTTLDPNAQRGAERELETHLAQLDARVRAGEGPLQGAVVVMEAHSGDVLALVGGRDSRTSRYNRALLARRQVGSAFKPFVFAAAVARGFSPGELLLDEPTIVRVSRNDVWEPGNFDGRFEGPVTVRDALVRSRNVPTVRLASAVGLDDIVQTARAAGITADMDATPALALGTPSITPLQMAVAYSTFATLGTPATPRFVVRVEDRDGTVLWEAPEPSRTKTLGSGISYIVTDMLRDAVDFGTGAGVRRAGFHAPAAGKTGTSSDAVDAWFVGYTPDVVGAVWIGYDRPSPLGPAATGGGFAAPVWGGVMRAVYEGRPTPRPWQRPDSVLVLPIDPESGLILASGCYPHSGGGRSELFLLGYEPDAVCPSRGGWFSEFWHRITGNAPRDMQRDQRDLQRERPGTQRELRGTPRELQRMRADPRATQLDPRAIQRELANLQQELQREQREWQQSLERARRQAQADQDRQRRERERWQDPSRDP